MILQILLELLDRLGLGLGRGAYVFVRPDESADDALVAVLSKLDVFRGDSRRRSGEVVHQRHLAEAVVVAPCLAIGGHAHPGGLAGSAIVDEYVRGAVRVSGNQVGSD